METCDLVVVGAGPGGYVAAIKAAQAGLSCVVVERAEVGGTCLNRGCIPTKSILHSAELYEQALEAEAFGIRTEGVAVHMAQVRDRARAVVTQLRTGVESLLEANGVEVVRGQAKVCAGPRVEVRSDEGALREFAPKDVIIATGSKPSMPPIEGLDLPGVCTSDGLLADVPEPGRLVVIGGGVIGMEFACGYAQFGSEVTVIEAMPRILPTLDREIGQSLSLSMKKRGCVIVSGARVLRVREEDGALAVDYESKGSEQAVRADRVLVATGRSCDVDEVCAEDLRLETDRGRIVVDESMKSSVDHVYAIGDIVAGGVQLAHAASAQGIAAVCAIAGKPCEIDLRTIPSCVYTTPEIASVGLDEAEAKAAGKEVKIGKFVMSGNGKTVIGGLDRGFVKVIADPSGRVLGAQLMCGRATDIVGECALAIANGLTVEEMLRAVRPHPTFEEGVSEALEAFFEGSVHAMPKRKAGRR